MHIYKNQYEPSEIFFVFFSLIFILYQSIFVIQLNYVETLHIAVLFSSEYYLADCA